MRKNNILTAIMVSLLATGCYDDLGQYDYHDINDMKIDLKSVFEVKIPGSGFDTLDITPIVTQTNRTDNSNLVYLWRLKNVSNGNRYEEYFHEKDIQIITGPNDQENLDLRFEVKDTILGIASVQNLTVKKRKPFQYGWFVLQNVGNQSLLGCIDGRDDDASPVLNVDNIMVNPVGTIVGRPLSLGPNMFYFKSDDGFTGVVSPRIDIVTDQMGYRYEVSTMQKIYEYPDLLLYKKFSGDNSYNIQYSHFLGGEVIIENGTFWFANGEGDGHSVYYPVKVEGIDSMDYSITNAYSPNLQQYALAFDKKYHRFLWYPHSDQAAVNAYWTDYYIRNGKEGRYDINGTINQYRLRPLTMNSHDSQTDFDPQNIGNYEIVYMGGSANRRILCCGIEPSGTSLHIYEISYRGLDRGDEATCPGYYEYSLPNDADKCHFASSNAYGQTLFMAEGNSIHRLTLSGKSASDIKILELTEAPGSEITNLKFEHEQQTIYQPVYDDNGIIENYIDHKLTQRLGLSVHYIDGTWGIVSIELDDNGNVMNYWIYKVDSEGNGFNDIVDISYISQPLE